MIRCHRHILVYGNGPSFPWTVIWQPLTCVILSNRNWGRGVGSELVLCLVFSGHWYIHVHSNGKLMSLYVLNWALLAIGIFFSVVMETQCLPVSRAVIWCQCIFLSMVTEGGAPCLSWAMIYHSQLFCCSW